MGDLPEDTGKWTVVVDDCYKSPYAYNGPYWIGYDDVDSIAAKTKYVNLLGVAGAMIWSKDTDDFRGLYSNEKYPLTKKINEVSHLGLPWIPRTRLARGR